MSIAALCYLSIAVDNTTYKDAVQSDVGKRARKLLTNRAKDLREEVRSALQAFLNSEADFKAALELVYSQIVKDELPKSN